MVGNNTTNPDIQQGVKAVFELNADTVLREQIRARDKAIRDYENDMAEAKDEGRAEGEINAYVNLVRKGLLKPEIAAQQSNMNLDDFNRLCEKNSVKSKTVIKNVIAGAA